MCKQWWGKIESKIGRYVGKYQETVLFCIVGKKENWVTRTEGRDQVRKMRRGKN
jgi:hypothetical protein